MNKKITTGREAANDIPANEPPLALVLICRSCATTYEPTPEDWAWGRTSCPSPDCDRGWAWTASLEVPGDPR